MIHMFWSIEMARIMQDDDDIESHSLTNDVDTGKVLRQYSEFLSDVGYVEYTAGGEKRRGFGAMTEPFNDNVTVGLPIGMSVRDGFRKLRDILGDDATICRGSNGRSSEIRMICQPSCATSGLTAAHYRQLGEQGVRMIDIDYTVDACNITTRSDILGYLHDADVADRGERAVGRNCVSWWALDRDGDRVRIKVYNTFAQVLESAGVRVLLGSGLHNLLNGSDKADMLLKHREHGVSRVELTFYGERLKSRSVYHDMVLDVVTRRLAVCPTYSTSLSQQWGSFRSKITRTAAVHHVETSTFAYCHWWNSLTGMMQGATRTVVNAKEVPKLLGNYSFYDMPMHLITITGRGESCAVYRRVHGGSQITMCCGSRGGLYPHGSPRMLFEYGYGVGDINTGYIGWPKKYSYRSRPLALVEADVEDGVDTLTTQLEELTVLNRDYVAAHSALIAGGRYTVVGVGYLVFRGQRRTYLKLSDGQRIRCGASLEELVHKRTDGDSGAASFVFVVDKLIHGKGLHDAICFEATPSDPDPEV